jgi:Putative lumazine-binding
MKILKKMMMALAVMFTCGVSYAASSHSTKNPTKDEVINTYLNAVVHGKLAGIDDAINDDAQFTMTRGERVNTLNKRQILENLKSSENIEQGCQCTKTVVQDSDDMTTQKVEMKYDDFTRTDVITAQRVGRGWEITKVDTSFK